MLKTTDTYQGTSAASAAQINAAFAARGALRGPIGALVMKYSPLFGFRSEALAGQIADETGWLTNYWTTAHNNIMSIGVTGEATATPQSGPDWQVTETPAGRRWLRGYHFPSLEAGLLAGCIHMATYIYGRDKAKWPPLCRAWCGDTVADPRLPALLGTTWPGTVTSIARLGNGAFAAASGYAEAIVVRANIVTGIPAPITTNLGVPDTTPAFYAWLRARGIAVVEDYVDDGWVGRGGMQPEGIVHHVTAGRSVRGSIDWWRNGVNADGTPVDASTHNIIAGPTDPSYKDGTLVVCRKDEDQAWANGVWSGSPRLDLPTLARWKAQGINPNRVTLSGELSAVPTDANYPSAAMMTTTLYRDLHWMAKYPGITADRAHLLRHADFDPVNRSNCPGARFDLDKLILDIAAAIAAGDDKQIETAQAVWAAIQAGVPPGEAWLALWR